MVLRWIAAILLAFYLIDLVLRLRLKQAEHRRDFWPGAKPGHLNVYLIGVLADGKTSSDTVRGTWLKHGDVLAVSYLGKWFDGPATVAYISGQLKNRWNDYQRITIIGSSMGGMLALRVLAHLRSAGYDISKIDLLAVDTPTSRADIMDPMAQVARWFPIGPILDLLLTPVLRKNLVPPKDENIESHLDKSEIKQKALVAMWPYHLSFTRDQTAWMARTGAGRLDWSVLNGLNVVYLMCTRNNETIKQPQAANTWRKHAPHTKIVEVNSTHCGYLERPITWNQVFDEALS